MVESLFTQLERRLASFAGTSRGEYSSSEGMDLDLGWLLQPLKTQLRLTAPLSIETLFFSPIVTIRQHTIGGDEDAQGLL